MQTPIKARRGFLNWQKLLQEIYKKTLIRANKIFNKIDSVSFSIPIFIKPIQKHHNRLLKKNRLTPGSPVPGIQAHRKTPKSLFRWKNPPTSFLLDNSMVGVNYVDSKKNKSMGRLWLKPSRVLDSKTREGFRKDIRFVKTAPAFSGKGFTYKKPVCIQKTDSGYILAYPSGAYPTTPDPLGSGVNKGLLLDAGGRFCIQESDAEDAGEFLDAGRVFPRIQAQKKKQSLRYYKESKHYTLNKASANRKFKNMIKTIKMIGLLKIDSLLALKPIPTIQEHKDSFTQQSFTPERTGCILAGEDAAGGGWGRNKILELSTLSNFPNSISNFLNTRFLKFIDKDSHSLETNLGMQPPASYPSPPPASACILGKSFLTPPPFLGGGVVDAGSFYRMQPPPKGISPYGDKAAKQQKRKNLSSLTKDQNNRPFFVEPYVKRVKNSSELNKLSNNYIQTQGIDYYRLATVIKKNLISIFLKIFLKNESVKYSTWNRFSNYFQKITPYSYSKNSFNSSIKSPEQFSAVCNMFLPRNIDQSLKLKSFKIPCPGSPSIQDPCILAPRPPKGGSGPFLFLNVYPFRDTVGIDIQKRKVIEAHTLPPNKKTFRVGGKKRGAEAGGEDAGGRNRGCGKKFCPNKKKFKKIKNYLINFYQNANCLSSTNYFQKIVQQIDYRSPCIPNKKPCMVAGDSFLFLQSDNPRRGLSDCRKEKAAGAFSFLQWDNPRRGFIPLQEKKSHRGPSFIVPGDVSSTSEFSDSPPQRGGDASDKMPPLWGMLLPAPPPQGGMGAAKQQNSMQGETTEGLKHYKINNFFEEFFILINKEYTYGSIRDSSSGRGSFKLLSETSRGCIKDSAHTPRWGADAGGEFLDAAPLKGFPLKKDSSKSTYMINTYLKSNVDTSKKLYNNIYCLSHRERWEIESDWNFLYYYITAQKSENNNINQWMSLQNPNNWDNLQTAGLLHAGGRLKHESLWLTLLNKNKLYSWSSNQTENKIKIGSVQKNVKNVNKISYGFSKHLEPALKIVSTLAERYSKEKRISIQRQVSKIIPNYKNQLQYTLDKANLLNTDFFETTPVLNSESGNLQPSIQTSFLSTSALPPASYANTPPPELARSSTAAIPPASMQPGMQGLLKKSTLFSGPGIIQLLLSEFNFFEIKKMDKQNRILLYQLNKLILKLKKKNLTTPSRGSANNPPPYTRNKKPCTDIRIKTPSGGMGILSDAAPSGGMGKESDDFSFPAPPKGGPPREKKRPRPSRDILSDAAPRRALPLRGGARKEKPPARWSAANPPLGAPFEPLVLKI